MDLQNGQTSKRVLGKRGLAGALALAAFAHLVASSGPASAADVFTINSIVSQSGPGSIYGIATQQGTDLAIVEVNAAGGLQGMKVAVLSVDDASNPANAANIAREMATDSPLVFLNTITTVSAVITPILNQAKVPSVGPQISLPALVTDNRPYIFSFFPNVVEGERALVKTWMAREKIRSVVIVVDQGDIAAKTQAGLAEKFVKENGGSVLETVNISTGSVNFAPVISRIRALKPNGVFISTLANDAAGLLSEIGKSGLKVGRAVTIAAFNPNAIAKAGRGGAGTYSFTYYLPTNEGGPDAVSFARKFRTRYGTAPIMQSALAYGMTKTVLQQLQSVDLKSGSLQERRDRIKDAIAAVHEFSGPFGKLTMGSNGIVIMDPFIVQMENGEPQRRQ